MKFKVSVCLEEETSEILDHLSAEWGLPKSKAAAGMIELALDLGAKELNDRLRGIKEEWNGTAQAAQWRSRKEGSKAV